MTRPGGTSHGTTGWTARASSIAAASAATTVVLSVIYLWDRAFFLEGDNRDQYLPVAMDIGRRIRHGEWLPVIDPNLGRSGNYALDIQYGVYEPTHWLVAMGLSYLTNLELAAFLWAMCFAVVLAAGTTALAHRLQMPGTWPVVAGLAVATSGWMLFWLAPDWIPGLVSLSWLPWFWWAWTGLGGRVRVRDCLGIAVFGYLVLASGWPSTWLAAGVLGAGLVVESLMRRDPGHGWRATLEPLAVRTAASLAGVAGATITLLPLYHAAAGQFTAPAGGVRNDNFLIVNLWDVASFAAPQLTGDVASFGASPTFPGPVFFAAWFAVVVVWCIRWDRGLWRQPGLVTSLAGLAGMVLLTQAPSAAGPLRDQIRQLGGAQFFLVVATCVLAASATWVITRARVAGVLLTFAAMGWISWSRVPRASDSVVGIVCVLAAAGLLLVVVRRTERLTALATVALTAALTIVAFGLHHEQGGRSEIPGADRLTPGALGLSAADEPILAVYGTGGPTQWADWQADGVGQAFSDLRAGVRVAPGPSSIGQRAFSDQFCILAAPGQGCPTEIAKLFQEEPTTSVPWVDLLGYRTIVVQGTARQRLFERVSGPAWRQVRSGRAFTEYRRVGPIGVTGRVTHVVGSADVRLRSLSNETQSYSVSSARGARLIFRDLYWPGYTATLNGHPLTVQPLDGMLLTVQIPPHAHGTLRVSYVPVSGRAVTLLTAGSVVVLASVCGWIGWRRRREPGAEGSPALS